MIESGLELKSRVGLTAQQYIDGVLEARPAMVARAITLVESSVSRDRQVANQVLSVLKEHSGNSIRIGITGVPGAGKSSFIETFGLYLCNERKRRLAVLAVDPSSPLSGGSILGDKTRMELLSQHPCCLVRPSPSGRATGGVGRRTREVILICEAAGYDTIIIETVGVGQGEVAVRSMSDFFLLLTLTGAGDELQGFKRGVLELADAILVNKADGSNIQQAKRLCCELNNILRLLPSYTPGWNTRAFLCSALESTGITEICDLIDCFVEHTKIDGAFSDRRKRQALEWLEASVQDGIIRKTMTRGSVAKQMEEIKAQVQSGALVPTVAAEQLLEAIFTDCN